ncbi:hypothetical protein SERLA73DRAFT_183951 [Serpula lacrymans var. lacrymans S7.3]|uniref:PIN domain-containing protein n=2 Tax=Serpula lacrymans var. lacrymans TaxID=341189 RepID=F8Q264_SERL3|nr:uncharacterized protein SERLADRAFT_471364 [Serpula lacrymans var. lacrymans S7.9]EGN97275.1 hypothetical protein SERLA73DRAFT_183951 [Serpula lacrymans var. lacrymans S7.3]EGO22870.1 hypothetical protein SERLADRAFT_471364 [Serpula lacrymans var. lacrymans S7.9]
MAESKGPTTAATASNKLAMSRALGAAFLNHQVEQLEKSVTRVPTAGSWRDRRQSPVDLGHTNKRGAINNNAKRLPSGGKTSKRAPGEVLEKEFGEIRIRRKSSDESRGDKDADLVIVDASVLVHALHYVKKWCREGREEVVIVPLEALNTLDLLKKGTSPLAQRARSASRILEAQVGTNPRIRVQRDDAFVLWDNIDFKDPVEEDKDKMSTPAHLSSSPEWVRRTICCARWEVDHAGAATEKKPKVVLAVLNPAAPQATVPSSPGKATDGISPEVSSPVPLPAPNPHTHKHEPRSSGILVSHWAARARIDMLEVKPTPLTTPSTPQTTRGGEDEEKNKRQTGRGRRNSQHVIPGPGANGGSGSGLVERPPAVMQMMEMVAQPSKVVRVLARGEKLEPDP